MLSLEFIGFVLGTVGKLMIAYTAVQVHYRFWREHQIDERVFSEMKKERNIGLIGIILILIGFILEAPAKLI